MTPPHERTDQHSSGPNLFTGAGIARLGDDFTDRETERTEIAQSLTTRHGHMLISGLRRMGKTSVLLAVRDELRAAGHAVIYVDLWTASTLEDMTTRIVRAAVDELRRDWRDVVMTFASRLRLSFEVSDATTGHLVPVPKIELRDAPAVVQRTRLVEALETLETLAAARKRRLVVMLDEFQEIEVLGRDSSDAPGVSPMKQVRAVLQQQEHVTYALAGSNTRLIATLQAPRSGALYRLARPYQIGPIDPDHMSSWIERRLGAMGIDAAGCSPAIVTRMGPRTRDIRTLAEAVAELARVGGRVTPSVVDAAVVAVVRERGDACARQWRDLTPLQQNVLRAVAAGQGGTLGRAMTRSRFSLGESSRISKTVGALVDRELLLREAKSVVFDDPWFREWVAAEVLGDVGGG